MCRVRGLEAPGLVKAWEPRGWLTSGKPEAWENCPYLMSGKPQAGSPGSCSQPLWHLWSNSPSCTSSGLAKHLFPSNPC